MTQHLFPIHQEAETMRPLWRPPCYGKLTFQGHAFKHPWWRFVCDTCGEGQAADDEEAAQYVTGISYQMRLFGKPEVA